MKVKIMAALFCAAAMCMPLAACGEDEQTPEIDAGYSLTADTDFDALVSDQVTEEQWDAAFSNEGFAGCTAQIVDPDSPITTGFGYKKTADGYDLCFKAAYVYEGEPIQDEMIAHIAGTQATEYRKVGDGYQYMTMDIGGDEHKDEREWAFSFRMYVAYDFAGQFEKFTYDETQHAYTYEGNTLKVPYSPMEAMGEYTVSYATLKFSGSKLAYAKVKLSVGDEEVYKYYDYGKTEVVIPADAQPMPEE